MKDETFLGDGLFASFDGFQIKLRAPTRDGDHEVFLEPMVFMQLYAFAKAVGMVRTE